MTPDELAHKARLAWLNADGPSSHDDWCKAVAVVLEEAAKVADAYDPRCDVCPRGVAAAINAWPEMSCRPTFGPSRIILHLPQKESSE